MSAKPVPSLGVRVTVASDLGGLEMPFPSLHVVGTAHPRTDSETIFQTICGTVEEQAVPGERDWTDEELVVLARIQAVLKRHGIALELEQGVTDEGDPWLALCTAEGDVFVHICRIGTTYLLDGPNLPVPLRGSDVANVMQRFVERTNTWSAALWRMQV